MVEGKTTLEAMFALISNALTDNVLTCLADWSAFG